MLTCVECGCRSADGRGWLAFLTHDPDEDPWPEAATYCPPCAHRVVRPVRHAFAYV
jgi:hypothetical protein